MEHSLKSKIDAGLAANYGRCILKTLIESQGAIRVFCRLPYVAKIGHWEKRYSHCYPGGDNILDSYAWMMHIDAYENDNKYR